MHLSDHERRVIVGYLEGDVPREEAVEELGAETVERVDNTRRAVEGETTLGLGFDEAPEQR